MANTAIERFNKGTLSNVENQIRKFQQSGELALPPNYSVENALKSAWLTLQETKDRNGNAALTVCTRESICNALMSMAIQGLNPDKKQCHFIVYGKQLVVQRSYLGSMAVAYRVDENIAKINRDVVYQDDYFAYEKCQGRTVITRHGQKLGNIQKDKIIAAYCTIIYRDGSEDTTIMTMDEIKQAWMQSQTKPVLDDGSLKDSSVHAKFTAEMAMKTVVNRACKKIINSSDDHNLLVRTVVQEDEAAARAEAAEEITVNANTEAIEVEFEEAPTPSEPVVDQETGEVLEAGEATEPEDPEGDDPF